MRRHDDHPAKSDDQDIAGLPAISRLFVRAIRDTRLEGASFIASSTLYMKSTLRNHADGTEEAAS